MTRQDFVLLAEVFRTHKKRYGFRTDAVVDELVSDMAAALATTNPRFDADHFVAACNNG